MHSAASTGSLDGEAHGDVASHPIASARGPIRRWRAAHMQLLHRPKIGLPDSQPRRPA